MSKLRSNHYPRIPWEGVADNLGSAMHAVGTATTGCLCGNFTTASVADIAPFQPWLFNLWKVD